MTDINETCPWEIYLEREVSPPFKWFSLGFAIFGYSMLATGLILWARNRNSPYLIRRSGSLVLLMSLGVAVAFYIGPIGRFDRITQNCVAHFTGYFLIPILIMWPMTMRLILWANRVRFNFAIAESVGINGLQEVNTKDPRFARIRYYASIKFGLQMVFVVIIPYGITMFLISAIYICGECVQYTTTSLLLFLTFAALVLFVSVFIIYTYRDVPDVIGIRKETYYGYVGTIAFALTGFLLRSLDVGEYVTTTPQPWDWNVLVDIGWSILFISTVPLQVYRSYFHETGNEERRQSLKQILSTDKGTRMFQLYLATELSLENILFYRSALKWKKLFDEEADEETIYNEVRRIQKIYLTTGSDMEVNIGSVDKEKVMEEINKGGKLSPELFDEIINEVLDMMASGSHITFKSSDFYKLYNGDVSPNELTWVHSTGLSTYSMLDMSEMDKEKEVAEFL